MPLNTANHANDVSEQPINECTPLLRKDSGASTVVASIGDEESIASSLPGKEPFIDIPRQDIASVISVLLLGKSKLSSQSMILSKYRELSIL